MVARITKSNLRTVSMHPTPDIPRYKRSSIENKYRSNEHIALNASRQEFIAFTQRKRKKLSQQAYNMIAVFVNNLQQKSTYLLLRISVSCNESNNIILIVRFRTLFCICGQGQK